MMKRIALIYMGGTFGCVGEPLAPMAAADFIPQLEATLAHHPHIDCLVAPSIKDSSACTATDWLQLVQYIQTLQQAGYAHFVIIHGTDTLSYAAAVLARCLARSAHVVLTGSQYPLLNSEGQGVREFSDAFDNLATALDAVQNCEAGVYLAFHQKVFHAQTALKQHSTELDAFAGRSAYSPFTCQYAAYTVHDDDIEKAKSFGCVSIMMQPIALEQQIHLLHAFVQKPPAFLILQGFGIGNIAANAALIDSLEQLYAAGCIPLLTTQVPFGQMESRYAVSAWTENAKIIRSDCASHADLYAKALKMYLQYASPDERWAHWSDQQI